jgi:hypothetical protein
MINNIDLEKLMPLEVDDEYILENEILSPPHNECLTTGFNINSRVFWTAIAQTAPENGAICR